MTAGLVNLWHLSLSSSIFEKKDICLTSATEPGPALHQQMLLALTPFFDICFAVGHHHNSATVLLKQYCFPYTGLPKGFQIRQNWVQILSQMYHSLALLPWASYSISLLSRNVHNDLYLIEWLPGLNNERKVLSTRVWTRGLLNKW